jgi:hypothetical protein
MLGFGDDAVEIIAFPERAFERAKHGASVQFLGHLVYRDDRVLFRRGAVARRSAYTAVDPPGGLAQALAEGVFDRDPMISISSFGYSLKKTSKKRMTYRESSWVTNSRRSRAVAHR